MSLPETEDDNVINIPLYELIHNNQYKQEGVYENSVVALVDFEEYVDHRKQHLQQLFDEFEASSFYWESFEEYYILATG